MKRKWDNLVYIDLFAGSGYARISENKIVKSSALIALSLPNPFTKYIICEQNAEKFDALKRRIAREHSDKNVVLFNGDSNLIIDQIESEIPKFNRQNKVLSFCFVDPFSINLHFDTIRKLGSKYAMDFLILLAFGMDIRRNIDKYLDENNQKITLFLDNEQWRVEYFEKIPPTNRDFINYIAQHYKNNMKKLNYIDPLDFHHVRSTDKNLSLYHLAFFSKHELGNEFWQKIKHYSTGQTSLF
jgi:three-Cys-motif partner protein